MERILSVIAAAFLGISFTACGGGAEPILESSVTTVNSPSQEERLVAEEIPELENTASNPDASNVLIVYFSRWGNTDYPDGVDATTSASIVVDKDTRYGTTEYVANIIADEVGGDLHRIETITPYSADFDELRNVNHDEMSQNYLPELKESNLEVSAYDTVFVGYPVWATDVPQAVLSFLNKYDLSGKTVVPFCTHDGYGAGGSYSTIAEASRAAVFLDGMAIESDNLAEAHGNVEKWLTDIGISGADSEEQNETAIQITIGGSVLDGVLYDTALAEEIKEYFPLTISMVEYGGREYYGGVDFYPENLEGGQRSFQNGEITYCEAHHNMAIFYAQTDNPNLSVDVIPIGRITSDLSIFDNLDSREDITFSLAQ